MAKEQTSFDTWAESFHFTEDLKELETMYLEQHYAEMEQQAMTPEAEQMPTQAPVDTTEPSTSQDAAFLDSLSQQIAGRLGITLSSPEVLERYFKMKDLEHDSTLMAEQIQELLHQCARLESDVDQLRRELKRYRKIFGSFYVKS